MPEKRAVFNKGFLPPTRNPRPRMVGPACRGKFSAQVIRHAIDCGAVFRREEGIFRVLHIARSQAAKLLCFAALPLRRRRCVTGSSPRVWGMQFSHFIKNPCCRFIPTSVGKAINCLLRSLLSPVHPHACGERFCGTIRRIHDAPWILQSSRFSGPFSTASFDGEVRRIRAGSTSSGDAGCGAV